MRILVTKTTRAAPDGLTVCRYEAGQSYDLPADLARVFIKEGWGREPDAPARGLAGGARDEKAIEAAAANKAFERAPETKTPPNPPRAKRRRRRKKRASQERADNDGACTP